MLADFLGEMLPAILAFPMWERESLTWSTKRQHLISSMTGILHVFLWLVKGYHISWGDGSKWFIHASWNQALSKVGRLCDEVMPLIGCMPHVKILEGMPGMVESWSLGPRLKVPSSGRLVFLFSGFSPSTFVLFRFSLGFPERGHTGWLLSLSRLLSLFMFYFLLILPWQHEFI